MDVALSDSEPLHAVKETPYNLVLLEHETPGKRSSMILDGLHTLGYSGAIFIVSARGRTKNPGCGDSIMAWMITW